MLPHRVRRACCDDGVPDDCERHLPPVDWEGCDICPPGECRWVPCVCGGPIERVTTRIPVPARFRVPRWQHMAGEARAHIATPRDESARDAQGERL